MAEEQVVEAPLHVVTMIDIAEAFGFHVSQGASVETLYLTAFDFYRLKLDETFREYFDQETSLKVLRAGIVGYLWGAKVELTSDLEHGEILISRTEPGSQDAAEDAEDTPVRDMNDPSFVAEIAVARIRKMGGYFGLEEKQTDDLADDVAQFLVLAASGLADEINPDPVEQTT